MAYNQIKILKSQVDILKEKELILSEDFMRLNSSALLSTEERVFINETLNKHLSPLDEIYHNISNLINNTIAKTGLYEAYPTSSCRIIATHNPSIQSGYYWVQTGNGRSIRVYCELRKYLGLGTLGWIRIAKLTKNRSSAECFSGLKQSALNRSSCVAQSDSATCSHTLFSSFNIPFSRIYCTIRAYGIGSPDGFSSTLQGINENYVDGISFTYGRPPNRQHIYTLVASPGPSSRYCYLINRPNFVSQKYYCLTTQTVASSFCSGRSCWNYFYIVIASTDQDIEMRVCRDQSRNDEDIVIEDLEIYVQ